MAKGKKYIELAVAAALFAGCAGTVLAADAATSIATRKQAMKDVATASIKLQIRADDFLTLAHVEENMRMIIRWRRPDAHELPGTDLDHRHARVVVEVGDDMFRHGNSSRCRGSRGKFRRHHSGEVV